MKTKTLFASLAVASLAIAQPLSAATRSADSLPQRSAQSMAAADRAGSLAGESEELRGSPVVPIVLITVIIAAIILAVGGGKSQG
jgi:hypothetical protein